MMHFTQQVLLPELQPRRLLTTDVTSFHQQALHAINTSGAEVWRVELGENLLFDVAGLKLIQDAIQHYRGAATCLRFSLQLHAETARDYYSHQLDAGNTLLNLPLLATHADHCEGNDVEQIIIALPCLDAMFTYPAALAPPTRYRTPLAVLLAYSCDHDLLFANQIAIFSALNDQIRRSPRSWIKGLLSRKPGRWQKRIIQSHTRIHPSAEINPSAVIEASVIGAGCRVGAHCVVRHSFIGTNVTLHDGAKVDMSVVDDNSWLMHDLVLYRSLVETDVFLIHGPYQFSYFQHRSAAFATIMLDYRPDARPIRIQTPAGVREYAGRFLGALLQEAAKVFGGSITAPGITIPTGKAISVDPEQITRAKDLLEPLKPAI